ncbi:uncharacterized protein LOC111894915 isoform X2 [Lactuca sativa]|uniref:uncharacterized protein LOC111894915 isoform X2 n=1 Tax=Lactuca sativa TaxID=4236 RepID=UPI000CD9EB9F|nr:uncharacterized protein LOC111894915 isoform X2 [Lactuca sativa]
MPQRNVSDVGGDDIVTQVSNDSFITAMSSHDSPNLNKQSRNIVNSQCKWGKENPRLHAKSTIVVNGGNRQVMSSYANTTTVRQKLSPGVKMLEMNQREGEGLKDR